MAAVVIFGLVGGEIIFERQASVEWQRKDAVLGSYYQWCFTDTQGNRIGTRRGRLKLMYQPYLLYANLPNQTDPHFHINGLGTRGPEIGPKAKGTLRILLLGGSAAFGTGLQDDSETLAHQLEMALPKSEVINAAVIGYQSLQELTGYVNKWSDLNPDLVIEFGGHNDFYQGTDRGPDFQGMNGAWQTQSELRKLNDMAYANFSTRLLNLPRAALPEVASRLDTMIARLASRSSGGTPPAAQPATGEFYAANMGKLDKVSRAFGARFLCVLQPSRSAKVDAAYKKFRDDVKARFLSAGVDFVDANESMEKLTPASFMDGIHLGPEGNRIVALALARILRERGFAK